MLWIFKKSEHVMAQSNTNNNNHKISVL